MCLLHFLYYCTVDIKIIISVTWRSEILVNIRFSSAQYIHSICYTVGFTSLMTYMWLKNKYQNTSRDKMKIVENTTDITTLWQASPPQSRNHSCVWRWKWLFIFMLKCLLLTNSSVKHSLSMYLLIIIIYFCSYNTGWDEKQVLFTRLITILFHETHLHLYPR